MSLQNDLYLLNAYFNILNPKIQIHGCEYVNSRMASTVVNLHYSDMISNLFMADASDLKLPDNSFDIVYSSHVLEQLGQENAVIALREMWRVCRKGIALTEPSIEGANIYEKWRINTLEYCKDLHGEAKNYLIQK